jgi:hypothetical protein
MEQGDLDWDGNYLAGLTTVKVSYPNIVTYFENAPYFPDKAADLLVPNYRNYPLNQTWLHQALMSVLDYTAMSEVDSSYLKTPNVMLIPADDAAAQATLNKTLATQYTIAYDGTGTYGKNLLSTYCSFNQTTQTWFTKATIGGYHYPLAEWTVGNNATIAPWKILDFNGWTDVDAMDTIAAYAFTHLLNISVVVDQGPANQWGVVQGRVNGGNFDLFNMVMSGQLNMNMYERYFQMFSLNNPAGAGGGVDAPLGGYKNTALSNLIDQLDTMPAGSAAQWAVANQMQNIIGTDLPYIPLGGHPDWQVYSTAYWTGWPGNATNPILPGSPYAGITQNANLLAITFGLTNDTTPPATITDLAAGSPTDTSITLTWTAPGDNSMFGNATGYVVKYSTLGHITAANWTSATTCSQSWTPAKNGTLETHTVSGLSPATKYWFAVEAYDTTLNYGGVSNSPSGTTTTPVPPPPGQGIPWIIILGGVAVAVIVGTLVTVVLVKKKKPN